MSDVVDSMIKNARVSAQNAPETPDSRPKRKGFKDLAAVRALSDLMQRMSWMKQAGLSFDGNRDMWAVFGYQRSLKVSDLYAKYLRQDVAKTVVDAPADAIWTNPPVLRANSRFELAWERLLQAVPVWDVINRADKMTGYGRYSIIVLGLGDASLEGPAREGGYTIDNLLFLQPYSELGVTVEKWNENAASPRFGQPEIYRVQINEADVNNTGKNTASIRADFRIHWTRVVHIAADLMEDRVYGQARLTPVYNILDDLLKVAGGTAEVFWLTANRGMQLDVDKDMSLDEEDAAALTDEIDEYTHGLRRVMRTRGVKINELGAKVPSPHDTFETLISLLCGTTRIPRRILLGAEAGQLASDQDRANWAERVGERRSKFAEPHALAPFLARLIWLGILPKPFELELFWPEAFILGPLERAQTSAQKARSAANLTKTFVDIANANAKNTQPLQAGGSQPFGGRPAAPAAPSRPGTPAAPPSGPAAKPAPPPEPRDDEGVEILEPLLTRDEARKIIGFGDVEDMLDDTRTKTTTSVNAAGTPRRPIRALAIPYARTLTEADDVKATETVTETGKDKKDGAP